MVKGFIFDMDGTVIDSTQNDYQAWEIIMKEKGIHFPYEEFIALLGAKGKEIVQKYISLPDEEIKEMLEKKEKIFKDICEEKGLHPIEGVTYFLDIIHELGIPMALATGAEPGKLDFIFARIDIKNYFKVILTSKETKNGKPNPEIFLNAAEKLGILPSEAMVVEDSVYGVEAAKKGGFRCLALTSTNSPAKLSKADYIIDAYRSFDWNIIREETIKS